MDLRETGELDSFRIYDLAIQTISRDVDPQPWSKKGLSTRSEVSLNSNVIVPVEF